VVVTLALDREGYADSIFWGSLFVARRTKLCGFVVSEPLSTSMDHIFKRGDILHVV